MNKVKNNISIFEVFKIGIGPSSSHTMGPWKISLDFVEELKRKNVFDVVTAIQIELLGSLCKTGKGHGTDLGIVMGLLGEKPDTIDQLSIANKLEQVQSEKKINIFAEKVINFNPKKDIIFTLNTNKAVLFKGKLKHPNTMVMVAHFKNKPSYKITYHSIGGGFIERAGKKTEFLLDNNKNFTYPISSADDIISHFKNHALGLDEQVMANELCWKTEKELNTFINQLIDNMIASVYRGCHSEGVLPGGLRVNRRAKNIYQFLIKKYPKKKPPLYNPTPSRETLENWINFIRSLEEKNFEIISNWVICFALAVNEENASYRRVVTAPTNGAAGVIPAVFLYYLCFNQKSVSFKQKRKFLLCASEIGSLFKKGATISAAAGGCQAEIGVSSSMAAGALTSVKGGSIHRILMASEIAMEHHLGLTCDPIKGLVQVPCIERNSMGAMKALTATQIALRSDPNKNIVQLDDVIKTMWQTAKDMNTKYKETSEGGLSTNVSVNFTEC